MKVSLVKYPAEEDWMLVKQCALVTVGKEPIKKPTAEWKHKMLNGRHSPIRELKFVFLFEDIPYWVAMHLARHKHAEPYIKSQRNDRQEEYDRNKAPQDAPVNMMYSVNAEELMIIANKRLCNLAAAETRKAVREMCLQVLNVCPEFTGLLVPMCVYHGNRCHEINGCGKCKGDTDD